MNDYNRLNSIDILKGICMIFVVLVHAGGGEWQGYWAILGNQGAYLVYFLLIVSGFLTWKSIENRKIALQKWFINRFIRLMPLWYVSIVMSVIRFSPISFLSEKHNIYLIFINLLFLNGLDEKHYSSIVYFGWYIGALAICYVWTVILNIILKNKKTLKMLVIVEIFTYILGLFFVKIFEILGVNNANIEHISIWIAIYTLGIVAYYIKKEIQIKDIFWVRLIGIGGLLLLLGEAQYLNGIWLLKNGLFRFGLCYFIIFISLLYKKRKMSKLKVLPQIGKNSLVIYLFHYYPLTYFPWELIKIDNIIILSIIKVIITVFICMCFAYIWNCCTYFIKKRRKTK